MRQNVRMTTALSEPLESRAVAADVLHWWAIIMPVSGSRSREGLP